MVLNHVFEPGRLVILAQGIDRLVVHHFSSPAGILSDVPCKTSGQKKSTFRKLCSIYFCCPPSRTYDQGL